MKHADEAMIAAAEALILCSRSAPDPPPPATPCGLWSPGQPRSATGLEKIPSSFLPLWGFRSRRSRFLCSSKPELETERARPSPSTPLDFSSSSAPSTSGSDGAPFSLEISPAKSRFAGDPDNKKASSALVWAASPSSKPIRRQGRKKTTITELREQERALAEENTALEKMVESARKEMEELMEENRRMRDEKKRRLEQRGDGEERGGKRQFLLPDLNEGLMEA